MKKITKILLAATAVGGAAATAFVVKKKMCSCKVDEDVEENEVCGCECVNDFADNHESAVSVTTTYPSLTDVDMEYLNEISESQLDALDLTDKTVEKAIQHKIEFNSTDSLNEFKMNVINEGFVVTNGETENELLVLNITTMDSDALLSKVFFLANLAKESDAKYIDWIIK